MQWQVQCKLPAPLALLPQKALQQLLPLQLQAEEALQGPFGNVFYHKSPAMTAALFLLSEPA